MIGTALLFFTVTCEADSGVKYRLRGTAVTAVWSPNKGRVSMSIGAVFITWLPAPLMISGCSFVGLALSDPVSISSEWP